MRIRLIVLLALLIAAPAPAQTHPTPDTAFMKHLDGFLDPSGAPTFTSSFMPSGPARVVSRATAPSI